MVIDDKSNICYNLFVQIATKTCYCEHSRGRTPDNGIICGMPDDYQLIAYCHEHQDCTGPNNPKEALLITIIDQLCSVGMFYPLQVNCIFVYIVF